MDLFLAGSETTSTTLTWYVDPDLRILADLFFYRIQNYNSERSEPYQIIKQGRNRIH